ncbi:MAG: PetM family cytochrome b6-f complex subunit 7 [Cyanobacteria bacterium J06592_8]
MLGEIVYVSVLCFSIVLVGLVGGFLLLKLQGGE